MTMSATPNVPRWMRENRQSRESYIQSYGRATVNPATQSKSSNSSSASRAGKTSNDTGRNNGGKTS